MDLRAKQQELESALSNQDPERVARALVLVPLSAVQAKKEPRPRSPLELFVDEVDYGSVLTSWLDACAYAEAVSKTKNLESVLIVSPFPFSIHSHLGLLLMFMVLVLCCIIFHMTGICQQVL
jgi:hypothetical protein